jgi:hypothetical protein
MSKRLKLSLIILVLLVIAGIGYYYFVWSHVCCAPELPPDQRLEDEEQRIEKNLEDFYVETDYNQSRGAANYLKYGEQLLFEDSLNDLFDFDGVATTMLVFNTVDSGDTVKIYFSHMSDCGGCFGYVPNVVIFDKLTKKGTVEKLGSSPLFDYYAPSHIVSEDKSKIAYLELPGYDNSVSSEAPKVEQIRLYNFETGEDLLFEEIPDSETVIKDLDFLTLDQEKVYFNGNKLTIKLNEI